MTLTGDRGRAHDIVQLWLQEAKGDDVVALFELEGRIAAEMGRVRAELAVQLGRCLVAGCHRRPISSGMCLGHNKRQLLHGDPTKGATKLRSLGEDTDQVPADELALLRCFIPLCTREVRHRGMCNRHYEEWRRNTPKDKREVDSFPRTIPKGLEPAPGSPLPMATALGEDDVPSHRNLDCPAYDRCLNWVALRGWPGFSCKGCRGPAVEAS